MMEKFDYVILTESNKWVSGGSNETQKELDNEIAIQQVEHPEEKLIVVKAEKLEFIKIQ